MPHHHTHYMSLLRLLWFKSTSHKRIKYRRLFINLLKKMVDVEGDGHCDFHTIADLCGMYVDDHLIICLDILRELTSDCDCYLGLFGTHKPFNEVKHALTRNGIFPAPRDK